MYESLFLNIVSSIAFLLLGFSFEKILFVYRTRHYRNIWRPFYRNKKILLVLSTRLGPHERSSQRISFLEMQSYVNISNTLNKVGFVLIPKDSMVSVGEMKSEDLIVLGGGVANSVSKDIWGYIKGKLPYEFDFENHTISLDGVAYQSKINKNSKLTKDYGLIISCFHPYNIDKNLMLCMGCHGFATYGATLYLTEYSYVKALSAKISRLKNFAVLVDFDIKDNVVIGSNILHCSKIE